MVLSGASSGSTPSIDARRRAAGPCAARPAEVCDDDRSRRERVEQAAAEAVEARLEALGVRAPRRQDQRALHVVGRAHVGRKLAADGLAALRGVTSRTSRRASATRRTGMSPALVTRIVHGPSARRRVEGELHVRRGPGRGAAPWAVAGPWRRRAWGAGAGVGRRGRREPRGAAGQRRTTAATAAGAGDGGSWLGAAATLRDRRGQASTRRAPPHPQRAAAGLTCGSP